MANDSITTVLSIVAWGTKLTFGLYDFSVANTFGPACEDVNRLAKEVNLLSQVLRQIGSRLKEDGSLPTQDAFNVVRQVLDQCQSVFREIEALVPLAPSRQNSQDGLSPRSSVSPWREDVEWNVLCQTRAKYLLAHLESVKLTMSVMLQTLYTAKSIIWSRYDNTETAHEAASVERSQTECLVIEQQLALLRTFRLYESFRWQISNASPALLSQSPQSQALINRDEYGPSPRSLVAYQEPSLAQIRPAPTEAEDLGKVRYVSSSYVDLLLKRWTQIDAIEERLHLDKRPRDEPRREDTRERRTRQESAVESDEDGKRRPPKLQLTTEEPVAIHINDSRAVSSPISLTPRSATLQPPGGPFSPQPSNSWGPTSGGYFAQHKANASRRRVSPTDAPRPILTPSTSSPQPSRPQTAFKTEQPPPSPRSQPKRVAIPYRLRINQWYWDYRDADLIASNQSMSPHQAIKTVSKDTMPITEIFHDHVSRDALLERGYEHTRVMRERFVNGHTQEDLCYCIEGALRPEQVSRLVDITERIKNPSPSPSSVSSRSPRTSKSVVVVAPPLDRSNTAPVYGNKFRESHKSARDYDYETSSRGKSSSASNTSDEEVANYKTSSSSRSKSRSGGDRSYEERGSSRRRSSREGGRDKEKSKGNEGRKTQTLTKIAAGAGLATLLDGLPEMLSYL